MACEEICEEMERLGIAVADKAWVIFDLQGLCQEASEEIESEFWEPSDSFKDIQDKAEALMERVDLYCSAMDSAIDTYAELVEQHQEAAEECHGCRDDHKRDGDIPD